MKLIVERLNKAPKSSFVLQKDVYPHYPTPWHHHPEYELVLVLRSSGKKIIGDYMNNFSDGDLTFIGPFLPHVYHNDQIYYEENSSLTAEAIVIHFTDDFLGKDFFEIPEMLSIKELLEDSVTGFAITGSANKIISRKMKKMFSIKEPLKIAELLTILHLLAETKEKHRLSSPGFIEQFKSSGSERITRVCDHIMQNFTSPLTLEQAAKMANMSPNAFCSFFKQRTRKTFVRFLNEVRIGYACKLLSGEQFTISEICYKVGFQNVSNFNRQFKNILNKTPKQYKQEMAMHRI